MQTMETLIEQVRAFLIQSEDNKPRHEIYNQFINEAKANNLNEEDFYRKVLKAAHKGIDWSFIEEEKKKKDLENKANEEKERAIELELEELRKHIRHAPKFIDRLTKSAFDDSVVKKDELRRIFDRADRLSQDTYELAERISALIEEKNFKAYPNANYDLPSLRQTLCSTDWHSNNRYAKLTTPPPEPFPWKLAGTATLLILVAAGVASYLFYFQPKWRDETAPRHYTIAQNSTLRSSPVSGVDYNKVAALAFGTELITYDHGTEWCKVKVNDQEGYVATKLVLDKSDFFLLNSIFGDSESKVTIESIRCRVALLNYFKQHNYIGKMDDSMQIEAFGHVQRGKEMWQVFSKGKDVKPNTVFFPPKRSGAKYTDFVVIIKNIATSKRKLLLFSFNEMEVATLEMEQDAPDFGAIKVVKQFLKDGAYVSVVKY